MNRRVPAAITPQALASPAAIRRRIVFGLSLALAGCAEPYLGGGEAPRSTAPRPIATLDVEGSVEVRREGRSLPGRDGMALYRGDEIRTQASSYAQIRFADGDRVWLDYDTLVRLGSVFAILGRVFAAVSGVFEIDSEFVVASTEGTEFTVSIGRAGRNTFSVAVRSGVVRCVPRRGNWRPIRLLAGQRLRGQADQTPAAERLGERESQAEFGWVRPTRQVPDTLSPRPTPRPDPATVPQSTPRPSPQPQPQPQPTPKTTPRETLPQIPRREQIPLERKSTPPSQQIIR